MDLPYMLLSAGTWSCVLSCRYRYHCSGGVLCLHGGGTFLGTLIGTYIPNCTSSRTRRQTTWRRISEESIFLHSYTNHLTKTRRPGHLWQRQETQETSANDCFISALYNDPVLSMEVQGSYRGKGYSERNSYMGVLVINLIVELITLMGLDIPLCYRIIIM
jgi:hypothetical protein